ncbi:MAG TPA: DUF4340 domain-containing protein [bacterium]|nr:DUF4340 domain-containing protein [bacterium]
MKGKNELAILIFLIAVLAFYISNQKDEKTHYELPDVKEIQTGDISKINIEKKGFAIVLVKEAGKWLIGDKKYPADKSMVENMLNAVSGLTLTALASESKNYAMYELDEKGRVSVEAFSGDDLLRKISIGKNTPTHHQTFVMLDDNHRVYHSKGTIRRDFDRTVSELRDKKVMSFSDEISEIVLKKGGEEMTIIRAEAPVSVDVTEEKKAPHAPEEEVQKWTTADGKSLNDSEVDGIVSTLSALQGDDFIEDKTKEDLKSPIFTATLKGMNTYTISLFEKKDEQYPAVSSGSEYPFLLSEWKADKIMKDFEGLIEEEK